MKRVIHTGMYHGQVHLHPHPNCRQPLHLPQSLFHYSVSLVVVLLMGVLFTFLGKLGDPTTRIFCFPMHNTGRCHFWSQAGQSFKWFSSRAEQGQLFQVYSREESKLLISYIPTSQTSSWLVALYCDNLCPLDQSCIKLSIYTTAQHCTTDLAISQQATSPPSLNFLSPVVQLRRK